MMRLRTLASGFVEGASAGRRGIRLWWAAMLKAARCRLQHGSLTQICMID
ncbi:hypothetical protein [Noviherbaspirillum suwonense]|jgi:hypothetical protein|nr:hypothetical protein [Noviherbaspirillum suwonense]